MNESPLRQEKDSLAFKNGAASEARLPFGFFQYSFAIIFIWFGGLKLFQVSPAYELITRTFSIFPANLVNFGMGWWELLTGVLFLFRPTVKPALLLMALQIPGTFLPLFIVPEMCFVKVPWILTTNGEFILKNLLMIGGGLVLLTRFKSDRGSARREISTAV